MKVEIAIKRPPQNEERYGPDVFAVTMDLPHLPLSDIRDTVLRALTEIAGRDAAMADADAEATA